MLDDGANVVYILITEYYTSWYIIIHRINLIKLENISLQDYFYHWVINLGYRY